MIWTFAHFSIKQVKKRSVFDHVVFATTIYQDINICCILRIYYSRCWCLGRWSESPKTLQNIFFAANQSIEDRNTGYVIKNVLLSCYGNNFQHLFKNLLNSATNSQKKLKFKEDQNQKIHHLCSVFCDSTIQSGDFWSPSKISSILCCVQLTTGSNNSTFNISLNNSSRIFLQFFFAEKRKSGSCFGKKIVALTVVPYKFTCWYQTFKAKFNKAFYVAFIFVR